MKQKRPAPMIPTPPRTHTHTRAPMVMFTTMSCALIITLTAATSWLQGCNGLQPAPAPLSDNPPLTGPAESETTETISQAGREGISTLFTQPASAALHFSESFLNGLARDLLTTDTTVADIFINIPESNIPIGTPGDSENQSPTEEVQLHVQQGRWNIPVIKVRLQITEDESGEEHIALTTTQEAYSTSIKVALMIAQGDNHGDQQELGQCRLNVSLDETQFTNRLFLDISEGSGQFFHARGIAEHVPLDIELNPALGCQFQDILEDNLDSISTILTRAMEFGAQVHAGRIGYSLSRIIYNPQQVGGAWLPLADDYTGDTSRCGAIASTIASAGASSAGDSESRSGSANVSLYKNNNSNCNNSRESVPEPQSMLLLSLEPTWTYARNPSATWVEEGGAGMLLDVKSGIWKSHEQAPIPACIHTPPPSRQARAINPTFPAAAPDGLHYQVGVALSDKLISNTISYAAQAGFLCTPVALNIAQNQKEQSPAHDETEEANNSLVEEASLLIGSILPFALPPQRESSPFLRISSAILRNMEISTYVPPAQLLPTGTLSASKAWKDQEENKSVTTATPPEITIELDDVLLEIIIPIEESQVRAAWAVADLTIRMHMALDRENGLVNLILHSLQLDSDGQIRSNLITDNSHLATLAENLELLYKAALDKAIKRNLAWPLPKVASYPLMLGPIARDNEHIILYLRDP